MIRGRKLALAVATAAVVGVATPIAVGASQQAHAKQYTVKLLALKFSPGTINAKKGDTVKFVWVNGIHNVVSTNGPKVDSGKPAEKDKLTITLTKKGNFRFLCEPHQFAGMVLTIKVK
jgi:plastocyanin